jgi:hypothetical protein
VCDSRALAKKTKLPWEIGSQEKLAGWVARTRPPNAKTLPLNGLLFSAPQKVPIKQVNRYHGSIGFFTEVPFQSVPLRRRPSKVFECLLWFLAGAALDRFRTSDTRLDAGAGR